jgi:hypothetical protein
MHDPEIGIAPVGELPGVGVQVPPDEGEQAGLAAAVGSGDADSLPVVDGEAGLGEQQLGAAAKAGTIEFDHDG